MTDWKAETLVGAWALFPLVMYSFGPATFHETVLVYLAFVYLETVRNGGRST